MTSVASIPENEPLAIKFPVRVNQDTQLEDANGKIVIPTFHWLEGDFKHLKKQEKVALLVERALNEWAELMGYTHNQNGEVKNETTR